MASEPLLNVHKLQALELANLAIKAGAAADHETARTAWREALAFAMQHLPGDTMTPWIQSGLGDALLRCDDYEEALEMASTTLAFCASVQAPLAALTAAKAFLHLGDVGRARDHARQACLIRSEAVLKQFSPADQEILSEIGLSYGGA